MIAFFVRCLKYFWVQEYFFKQGKIKRIYLPEREAWTMTASSNTPSAITLKDAIVIQLSLNQFSWDSTEFEPI